MALSQLAFVATLSTASGYRDDVIYTCPASTRAFIKEMEIAVEMTGTGTSCFSQLFIKKTGGTAPDALSSTFLTNSSLGGGQEFIGLGSVHDASDGATDTETTTKSLILEAGDTIELAMTTAGSETFNYTVLISGDATAT